MGNRIVFYCDMCKKDLDLDNSYTVQIRKKSDIEKLFTQEDDGYTTYHDLCFNCMTKVRSFIANEMED